MTALIEYNAKKSDLPILRKWLGFRRASLSMSLTKPSNAVHLTSTALKISNSTVAEFLGVAGKSHDKQGMPAWPLSADNSSGDQGRLSEERRLLLAPSEAWTYPVFDGKKTNGAIAPRVRCFIISFFGGAFCSFL